MEAHKNDFLPMYWKGIKYDPQTPNETLANGYCLFLQSAGDVQEEGDEREYEIRIHLS